MDIKQQIAGKARELLDAGRIKGLVGMRRVGAHIAPFVFTDPSELEDLYLGEEDGPGVVRLSLLRLLTDLAIRYPADTFGLVARGCDERALENLMADERVADLSQNKLVLLGYSCSPEQAEHCSCPKPWPDALIAGEKTPGAPALSAEDADPVEELAQWLDTFNRCLKCLGCKSVCPVCGCKECTMDTRDLVPQRQLPIDPNFLMTRAMHMIDRCVYCGLCEQACPAHIPLRKLYRLAAEVSGQGDGFAPAPVQDKPAA